MQADQLAKLERQGQHMKKTLTTLHDEEDQSLQKQRCLVAACDEEVCSCSAFFDAHVQ